MANPFLTTATGNGATTDFTMGFTMDVDLTYLDVTCTLNGTKLTNFTKISTTAVRFVAPIPSGSLVFERFTPGGRKFVFTPGTRIIAAQVGGEFDRQSADSLEAGQFSWRNYYTARANPGAYVRIDALGEHEILDTNVSGVSPTWGSPGAIGAATPNTGVFTALSSTGTFSAAGTSTLGVTNISGLATFTGPVNFNGTQAQKDDTALSLGLSNGNFNFRNLFINGDFRFWRRQASATPSLVSPVGTVYGPDRWLTYFTGTAPAITYSRQLHTLGQTLVPGNPKYFFRAVQTVAPSVLNGFIQRIEDVTRTAGQVVNVRLNGARFDTARTLNYTITQVFGTGGAPSGNVTVATGSVPMGSTFAGYNITFTPPSVSGKTLGTTENTSYLEVRFEFPLTAAFTFECSDLQAEIVQTAGSYTRFERRTDPSELLLCARYCGIVTVNIQFTGGQFTRGAQAVNWPVLMRTGLGLRATTDVVAGSSINMSGFPAPGATLTTPTREGGGIIVFQPNAAILDSNYLGAIWAFEDEL